MGIQGAVCRGQAQGREEAPESGLGNAVLQHQWVAAAQSPDMILVIPFSQTMTIAIPHDRASRRRPRPVMVMTMVLEVVDKGCPSQTSAALCSGRLNTGLLYG
jgi:hypothetical protein